MAQLSPPKMSIKMCGMFAFSGKATAFLLVLLTDVFTRQRVGMVTIVVFLILGVFFYCGLMTPIDLNGNVAHYIIQSFCRKQNEPSHARSPLYCLGQLQ